MIGIIARTRDALERTRVQPDVNRAGRCVVAFMAPLLAAHAGLLPIDATFAALAAQNIALVDVRGSYPLRFGLLLTMAVVLAAATWLGSAASGHLPFAVVVTVLVMLAGGVWRHLSADYGPSLATASGLLLLIAMAHPAARTLGHEHFLSSAIGGLWGVTVQVALWPFRAQHPRRRAVADSWLAVSDLIEAMAPEAATDVATRHRQLAERQAEMRLALDQASAVLAAASTRPSHPYLQQLGELNLAAARLATRVAALNTTLETLMERPEFAPLAPSFAPVFTSLINSARNIALTVVSRQPSHLAATEIRLQRLGHLLPALQERVLSQISPSDDRSQLNVILQQISALVPELVETLRRSIDRVGEHTAFSVELFDLQTWTLRPLASTLNFQWRSDPVLLRFIARSTVLQVLGVVTFTHFNLERGYWLPLTMLVVLQPDYGATRLRAVQRVLGTLAGGLLATLLLWWLPPPSILLGATAFTIAGFAFWLKRNYTVAVFFITLFVVLITEASAPITVAFTVERLLATAAGGVLALLAAQRFWPVWERDRLPSILAQSLRANRDFLLAIGERLRSGAGFDAAAIAAKRAAESANSTLFASLQRMSGDPKNQQSGIENAGAFANGNQRLTRALTVVAIHLAPGNSVDRADLNSFVTAAADTLDLLARTMEGPHAEPASLDLARSTLNQLAFSASASSSISPLEQSARSQFARCTTELSAMVLAAQARKTA